MRARLIGLQKTTKKIFLLKQMQSLFRMAIIHGVFLEMCYWWKFIYCRVLSLLLTADAFFCSWTLWGRYRSSISKCHDYPLLSILHVSFDCEWASLNLLRFDCSSMESVLLLNSCWMYYSRTFQLLILNKMNQNTQVFWKILHGVCRYTSIFSLCRTLLYFPSDIFSVHYLPPLSICKNISLYGTPLMFILLLNDVLYTFVFIESCS